MTMFQLSIKFVLSKIILSLLLQVWMLVITLVCFSSLDHAVQALGKLLESKLNSSLVVLVGVATQDEFISIIHNDLEKTLSCQEGGGAGT